MITNYISRCYRQSVFHHFLLVVVAMILAIGVSKVQCFQLPPTTNVHHRPITKQQQDHVIRQRFDGSFRKIDSNMMMIGPDQIHDVFISPLVQYGLDASDFISASTNNHHIMRETMSTAIITTNTGTSEITTQWIADAANSAAAATTTTESDGGWWKAYINIFKSLLSFVHSTIDGPLRSIGIEQTWGISIFLFTAIIRSSLLPLSIQQSKSAEYMKALRPYMSDIKIKFKGNDQAIQRATGKLIEDAKQNPLSGCFLSVVQIPVFLGLYRGVRLLALDNQLNEPFLWIPSLEGPVAPPDYTGMSWIMQGWTASSDGGFPYVPQMGWETTLAFLIMPVVLVVLQTTTMSVLQPPMDQNLSDEEKKTMESTQQVFKFLPLLIGFFALQVPAALTIYWFTSNIFTLTQTLGVRAYFKANPPKIELPEYWESALGENSDNMTPEDRRKISEAGIRVGPTFDDLVDEAKFHSMIERPSIRNESAAWQRVMMASSTSSNGATTTTTEFPTDLSDWIQSGRSTIAVNGDGGTHHEHREKSATTTSPTTLEDDMATTETV